MSDAGRGKRAAVRRHRRRRFATGLNVSVSLVLLLAITLMANYLSYRYYRRFDLSRRHLYALSQKTLGLLGTLRGELDVIVVFRKNHVLYHDVKNLLKTYEYASRRPGGVHLRLEFVDPDRDLARARDLARDHDVHEANVVVFACGGRSRVVAADALRRLRTEARGDRLVNRPVAFLGEQVFSSAIHSVAQAERPVVYFLTGHAEHAIDDHEHGGYSTLARMLRRDNIDVRPLFLAAEGRVPDDSSALVIAGPARRLSQAEVDQVAAYLDRSGRVFVLSDFGVSSGMENLLEAWGVRLLPAVVVGQNLTGLGRDLLVMSYGRHPVTKGLANTATMFYRPQVVAPIQPPGETDPGQTDRPRVTVLAANTAQGWAEVDPKQAPPRFDPEVDHRGPVPLAAAVERGPVSGIDVELRPTRLVITGDSYFVSNGALDVGLGGNLSFFMSALNWLVEREALMGIEPKVPGELRLDMNRRQIRLAFLLMTFGVPGAAALAGWLVWLRRRH